MEMNERVLETLRSFGLSAEKAGAAFRKIADGLQEFKKENNKGESGNE